MVCGSNPRAEGSVKHAVATETTPENRDPPQDERTSKMHSDILTGDITYTIRLHFLLSGCGLSWLSF